MPPGKGRKPGVFPTEGGCASAIFGGLWLTKKALCLIEILGGRKKGSFGCKRGED